jgi:hypothetical protein
VIGDLLDLAEWLVKLAKAERDRKKLVFEVYVQPMHASAKLVYGDYLRLLTRVAQKLEAGEELRGIRAQLEEARLENKPERDSVRAILRERQVALSEMTRFEKGVWGLLQGGLSGFVRDRDYDLGLYGHYSQHTLLDLLDRLGQSKSASAVLSAVRQQIAYLERAWRDVLGGYAELQAEVLAKG